MGYGSSDRLDNHTRWDTSETDLDAPFTQCWHRHCSNTSAVRFERPLRTEQNRSLLRKGGFDINTFDSPSHTTKSGQDVDAGSCPQCERKQCRVSGIVASSRHWFVRCILWHISRWHCHWCCLCVCVCVCVCVVAPARVADVRMWTVLFQLWRHW